MSLQNLFIARIVSFSLLVLVLASAAAAQRTLPTPEVVVQSARQPMSVAVGNNLYCAGFIQQGPINTGNKIIGAQDEADKYTYAQNDFLYINLGQNKGVNVGDIFAVVRPRGEVKSKWTNKSDLGFYVQEVGALQVVNVKREVAVVRVKASCDSFMLGDLVQPAAERNSPIVEAHAALDRFGDPSGKATGRILMARDGAEMLSRDFIAYVDLGADNNVRVGDRLTVFRPLGKGNLFKKPENESVTSRDYGFESEVYKGGKFSNQSGRKSGEKADGQEVTTARAKQGRPSWLRKVVGEAVVLNVKERTATIVISRTGQEMHIGDWVEIK